MKEGQISIEDAIAEAEAHMTLKRLSEKRKDRRKSGKSDLRVHLEKTFETAVNKSAYAALEGVAIAAGVAVSIIKNKTEHPGQRKPRRRLNF